MSAEIVNLRDGVPLLSDIPGMLRRFADAVESGEYGDVQSLILLLPIADDYPAVFGWGDVEGQNDPIIQCELAKAWFVTSLVKRAR